MTNLNQHDKMKIHMRGYLIGKGYHTAYKAMDLMMEAFRDFRKDGVTPVWTHPLYIASVIRTLDLGEHEEAILITAFLHDYFEDRPEQAWKLEAVFDKNLLHYARQLDKNFFKAALLIHNKEEQNKQYYAAILRHVYTVIVKAVDRYHNLNTMLGVFSSAKIEEYIVETEEYVLPMLKQGMRLYPEFEAVLQNIKLGIQTQIGLLKKFQEMMAAKDQELAVSKALLVNAQERKVWGPAEPQFPKIDFPITFPEKFKVTSEARNQVGLPPVAWGDTPLVTNERPYCFITEEHHAALMRLNGGKSHEKGDYIYSTDELQAEVERFIETNREMTKEEFEQYLDKQKDQKASAPTYRRFVPDLIEVGKYKG